MQYRPPNAYQEVSNSNHFGSVSDSLGLLMATSQCMAVEHNDVVDREHRAITSADYNTICFEGISCSKVIVYNHIGVNKHHKRKSGRNSWKARNKMHIN